MFARGYGLIDSAKVKSEPGQDRQPHRPRRRRRAQAAEHLSGDLLVFDAEDAGEARVPARQREEPGRVAQRREDQRLLRLPRARQQGDAHDPAGVRRHEIRGRLGAPHPVRPGDEQHGDRDRPHRHAARARACSPTGPTASPRANCRPRSRRARKASERNVVITQWDFSDPKHYLHDITATDKRKPTLNRERPDLRRGRELDRPHPGARSGAVTRRRTSRCRCAIRRRRRRRTIRCRPRPTGATRRSGTARPARTTRCIDEKGRVWFTSRVGPPANPDFCRKGSDHPSAKVFPLETSTRHLSMLDPKTGKITLIRTCFQTHHLVFAEDANNTLWMSAGGPGSGVLGWLDRKVFEETGDEAEGAGLDADHPRHQRQRQARRLGRAEPAGRSDQGQAHRRRALWHRRQSAGRHDLGLGADLPGLRHPRRSGLEPVGDRARRNLRAADAGLRPARLRHRPQRRRLGAAVERPHGELRPQQMQGSAERPGDRDRPALPGRLDALSVPRAADAERDRHRQRGGELLHLGRPVRHVRPRRATCRGRPATPTSC